MAVDVYSAEGFEITVQSSIWRDRCRGTAITVLDDYIHHKKHCFHLDDGIAATGCQRSDMMTGHEDTHRDAILLQEVIQSVTIAV